MPINDNLRPGVYSRYHVSSAYTAPRSAKHAAVIARANGGEAGKAYRFASLSAAREVFSADTDGKTMLGCLQILFANGVSEVVAIPVDNGYAEAFALSEEFENIGALICDATGSSDLRALRDSAVSASGKLRERVAYCGIADAAAAAAAARELGCERVVLACPAASPSGGAQEAAVYTACALAGAVLAENDCAYNFNGYPLVGIELAGKLSEAEIQSLLAAGVCAVESVNGSPELVRALTTSTVSGGVPDRSLADLNTILIIDEIIPSVRASLRLLLRGLRLSEHSLQSVRTQVTVLLTAYRDSGVIESFSPPGIHGDLSDPAVCVVELSFKVAHLVSQIHLTAHIQV